MQKTTYFYVMIRELLYVGAGGAVGSVMRYFLSYIVLSGQTLIGIPINTLIVNIIGSLLIGVFMIVVDSESMKWLLVVGFCGGFTTFSTFSLEAMRLLRNGDYVPAILYIGVSVLVCVVCVAVGMWIGGVIKN